MTKRTNAANRKGVEDDKQLGQQIEPSKITKLNLSQKEEAVLDVNVWRFERPKEREKTKDENKRSKACKANRDSKQKRKSLLDRNKSNQRNINKFRARDKKLCFDFVCAQSEHFALITSALCNKYQERESRQCRVCASKTQDTGSKKFESNKAKTQQTGNRTNEQ
jgi:hypothetical protein